MPRQFDREALDRLKKSGDYQAIIDFLDIQVDAIVTDIIAQPNNPEHPYRLWAMSEVRHTLARRPHV